MVFDLFALNVSKHLEETENVSVIDEMFSC